MGKSSQMDTKRTTDPFMSGRGGGALSQQPFIEVVEQPRSRGLRFRYKCEGRSAGTIPGESSTQENRTYPTIKINNYSGASAIVVVSCVTKDEPHPRPHPHALVGKDCKEGVCTVKLKGTSQISFPSLGIQCATKKEVNDALKQREKIRVDPWGRGYYENINNIDLGQVRLAFQAFLPDDNGKYTRIVPPVHSQLIYDKKSVSDLVICRLSKHSSSVDGGEEIFLLCEKVNKEDIQVRFYEESKHGEMMWEAFGSFGPQDVHRQHAIVFKTPAFRDRNITTPHEVCIQLRRPSDDEISDPKPFQFVPVDPDPDNVLKKRKRKNVDFKQFLSDFPFTPDSPAHTNNTKDALKSKLLSKRPKTSVDEEWTGTGMDTEQPQQWATYSVTPTPPPPHTGVITTSYSSYGNASSSTQQHHAQQQGAAANTDGGLYVSLQGSGDGGATAVGIEAITVSELQVTKGTPSLYSLSKYLENYDGTLSLPSLGKEFPIDLQQDMGAQGVAAEETVHSSNEGGGTAAGDSNPQPSTQQQHRNSQQGRDPAAASLDRRIGDSMAKLQDLSN